MRQMNTITDVSAHNVLIIMAFQAITCRILSSWGIEEHVMKIKYGSLIIGYIMFRTFAGNDKPSSQGSTGTSFGEEEKSVSSE